MTESQGQAPSDQSTPSQTPYTNLAGAATNMSASIDLSRSGPFGQFVRFTQRHIRRCVRGRIRLLRAAMGSASESDIEIMETECWHSVLLALTRFQAPNPPQPGSFRRWVEQIVSRCILHAPEYIYGRHSGQAVGYTADTDGAQPDQLTADAVDQSQPDTQLDRLAIVEFVGFADDLLELIRRNTSAKNFAAWEGRHLNEQPFETIAKQLWPGEQPVPTDRARQACQAVRNWIRENLHPYFLTEFGYSTVEEAAPRCWPRSRNESEEDYRRRLEDEAEPAVLQARATVLRWLNRPRPNPK